MLRNTIALTTCVTVIINIIYVIINIIFVFPVLCKYVYNPICICFTMVTVTMATSHYIGSAASPNRPVRVVSGYHSDYCGRGDYSSRLCVWRGECLMEQHVVLEHVLISHLNKLCI